MTAATMTTSQPSTTTSVKSAASGRIPDTVRFWLRAEGAAVLVAGGIVYDQLGGNWFLFIPLLLLPDLAAIGYLAGLRVGAFTYNLVHNWVVGLVRSGARPVDGQRPDALRRHDPRRARRHGSVGWLRAEAPLGLQGHAPPACVEALAAAGTAPR